MDEEELTQLGPTPFVLITVGTTEAGLPYAIVKNSIEVLCGYVAVGRDHPWYEKDYDDCTLPEAKPRGERPEDKEPWLDGKLPPLSEMPGYERTTGKMVCNEDSYCGHTPEAYISVHGGITFAGREGSDVLPNDGEWWFGFDCGHYQDLVPGLEKYLPESLRMGGVYRDEAYVLNECEDMARQLMSVKLLQEATADGEESVET